MVKAVITLTKKSPEKTEDPQDEVKKLTFSQTGSQIVSASLISYHPSPSEGQGINVNANDNQNSLKNCLAKIRQDNPKEFEDALLQLGFIFVADSITKQGWLKTSALPIHLVEARRAAGAQRQKDYISNLSPEKAAARHAQQMAGQQARRMKKRPSTEPS